nr:MAG TPA: hypothetical protein [Caudoviricetes sp.]
MTSHFCGVVITHFINEMVVKIVLHLRQQLSAVWCSVINCVKVLFIMSNQTAQLIKEIIIIQGFFHLSDFSNLFFIMGFGNELNFHRVVISFSISFLFHVLLRNSIGS